MTPTLAGRFQTRIFLLLVVGIPWTLIATPFLPVPSTMRLGDVYRLTLSALVAVGLIGLVWDVVYYCLQQLRWDKDWPSSFALLNGINEGITTWVALSLAAGFLGTSASVSAFVILFSSMWVMMWLVAQGPMRVILLRWRFRGARVL